MKTKQELIKKYPELVKEIAKEFLAKIMLGGSPSSLKAWEEYVESLQPKNKWEILDGEFGYDNGRIENIRSVKRLSDSEVFSVGDKSNNGVIKSFRIDGSQTIVYFEDDLGNYHVNLDSLTKLKALFRTEDGVEMFEGDRAWYVSKNEFYLFGTVSHENTFATELYATFSTKEKAEEWILENKPCLSISELKSIMRITPAYEFGGLPSYGVVPIPELEQLAKQKIGL